MSFQPIIPFTGLAGWSFLQRTQASQQQAFEAQPSLQRDTDYFAAHIGEVSTPDDLINDYRLLKVTLGAFGLDDDLPNKAFIRKVLTEGSIDPESFANNLVDKRYLALTEAFSFDLGTPNTKMSDFAEGIIADYRQRQFEVAVGDQDNNLRLSLALERDLGEIVTSDNSDDGRWYAVMGSTSLRQVFETALGLPSETGLLDIDQQVEIFRNRAEKVFGDGEVSQFDDPSKMEKLNRLFLVRADIAAGSAGMSSGSIALTLLQGA